MLKVQHDVTNELIENEVKRTKMYDVLRELQQMKIVHQSNKGKED